MQNAGQYTHGAPSASQFMPSQTSGGSTTSSLRQFRKKDILEKNLPEPTSNTSTESHVARVAPHNHYPPKPNENYRFPQYHQFPEYINGPPSQVKYSEIASMPHHQNVNNVPTSVIQKPKTKEYMDMCNLQQPQPKPTFQDHMSNHQSFPYENTQYYPKETHPQVYSGYKPPDNHQYYPKEPQYHQMPPQQMPKFAPISPSHLNKYNSPESPFLSKLRRIHPNMAMSIINDHSDQREMYPAQNQNRYYTGGMQPHIYNTNNYPAAISHYQSYQNSCNYSNSRPPQMSTSRFPMNPHMERSISPRRAYTENLPLPMGYPQKPNYPQYNAPEYSQHYQHRRASTIHQDYLPQHYRPQYMPNPQLNVQEMQEIPVNHASESLKNFIENWDAEEDASDVAAIENASCKDVAKNTEDPTSGTVYMINASELQYLENNGIPLISPEGGIPLTTAEYLMKNSVTLDSGMVRLVDNSKPTNSEPLENERVVNIHITEPPKSDCMLTRQPDIVNNMNENKKIIVHHNTVLFHGNSGAISDRKPTKPATPTEVIVQKESKELVDKNCSPINMEPFEEYPRYLEDECVSDKPEINNVQTEEESNHTTEKEETDLGSVESKSSTDSPKSMPLIDAFGDMSAVSVITENISKDSAEIDLEKVLEHQDLDDANISNNKTVEINSNVKEHVEHHMDDHLVPLEEALQSLEDPNNTEGVADNSKEMLDLHFKSDEAIVMKKSDELPKCLPDNCDDCSVPTESQTIQSDHAKSSFSVDDIMNNIGNKTKKKEVEVEKNNYEAINEFLASETAFCSSDLGYEKQWVKIKIEEDVSTSNLKEVNVDEEMDIKEETRSLTETKEESGDVHESFDNDNTVSLDNTINKIKGSKEDGDIEINKESSETKEESMDVHESFGSNNRVALENAIEGMEMNKEIKSLTQESADVHESFENDNTNTSENAIEETQISNETKEESMVHESFDTLALKKLIPEKLESQETITEIQEKSSEAHEAVKNDDTVASDNIISKKLETQETILEPPEKSVEAEESVKSDDKLSKEFTSVSSSEQSNLATIKCEQIDQKASVRKDLPVYKSEVHDKSSKQTLQLVSSDGIEYRHAIKIEDNSVLLHFAGELVEVSFSIVNGKKVYSVTPFSEAAEAAELDVNDNIRDIPKKVEEESQDMNEDLVKSEPTSDEEADERITEDVDQQSIIGSESTDLVKDCSEETTLLVQSEDTIEKIMDDSSQPKIIEDLQTIDANKELDVQQVENDKVEVEELDLNKCETHETENSITETDIKTNLTEICEDHLSPESNHIESDSLILSPEHLTANSVIESDAIEFVASPSPSIMDIEKELVISQPDMLVVSPDPLTMETNHEVVISDIQQEDVIHSFDIESRNEEPVTTSVTHLDDFIHTVETLNEESIANKEIINLSILEVEKIVEDKKIEPASSTACDIVVPPSPKPINISTKAAKKLYDCDLQIPAITTSGDVNRTIVNKGPVSPNDIVSSSKIPCLKIEENENKSKSKLSDRKKQKIKRSVRLSEKLKSIKEKKKAFKKLAEQKQKNEAKTPKSENNDDDQEEYVDFKELVRARKMRKLKKMQMMNELKNKIIESKADDVSKSKVSSPKIDITDSKENKTDKKDAILEDIKNNMKEVAVSLVKIDCSVTQSSVEKGDKNLETSKHETKSDCESVKEKPSNKIKRKPSVPNNVKSDLTNSKSTKSKQQSFHDKNKDKIIQGFEQKLEGNKLSYEYENSSKDIKNNAKQRPIILSPPNVPSTGQIEESKKEKLITSTDGTKSSSTDSKPPDDSKPQEDSKATEDLKPAEDSKPSIIMEDTVLKQVLDSNRTNKPTENVLETTQEDQKKKPSENVVEKKFKGTLRTDIIDDHESSPVTTQTTSNNILVPSVSELLEENETAYPKRKLSLEEYNKRKRKSSTPNVNNTKSPEDIVDTKSVSKPDSTTNPNESPRLKDPFSVESRLTPEVPRINVQRISGHPKDPRLKPRPHVVKKPVIETVVHVKNDLKKLAVTEEVNLKRNGEPTVQVDKVKSSKLSRRSSHSEKLVQIIGECDKNVEPKSSVSYLKPALKRSYSSTTSTNVSARRVSFEESEKKSRTRSLDTYPESPKACSSQRVTHSAESRIRTTSDWEDTQSPKPAQENSKTPDSVNKDFSGLLRHSKPLIDISDLDVNPIVAKDEKLLEYKEQVDSKLSSLNIQIPRISKPPVPKSTNELMQRFMKNEKLTENEMDKIKEIISFKRKVQQFKSFRSPESCSPANSTYEVRKPSSEADAMKLHIKKISGKRKFEETEESASEDCDSDFTDISDRPNKGDYSVVQYNSLEKGVPKIIIKRKPEVAQPVVVLERIDAVLSKKQKIC